MFNKKFDPNWVIACFLVCILFINACEDNPAKSVSDEGHPITIGYTMEIGGEELIRYYRREFTLDPGGNFIEYIRGDTILVFHHGNIDSEAMLSGEITIRWLDDNEQKFSIPEWPDPEGEFFLGFDLFEPGSRSNHLPEEERPFEVIYDRDTSTWQFQLQILQSGLTDFRIRLIHGDHNDMVPVPLPIQIELD